MTAKYEGMGGTGRVRMKTSMLGHRRMSIFERGS